MKPKKIGPAYDERQMQILLKSYQYGFWTMAFLSFCEIFLTRFFPNLLSTSFIAFFNLYVGVSVSGMYANVNGASPMVDKRIKLIGSNYYHLICITLGLVICAMALYDMVVGFDAAQLFSRGGDISFLIIGLSLLGLGRSIVVGRNRLEADE